MRATNWLVTLVALGAPLVAAESAFAAPVAACGGIDFSEGVSCEVQTSGGCTAACTPVNVDTQCAVMLTGGCSGMCTAQAQASCTGSCNTQCQADCMANASFDCDASCNTQCQGNCTAECSDAANQGDDQGQCMATCNANCSTNCNAGCMGQASASCEGKCTGSCQGQCTASANIDCEVKCTPPSAYVNCETTVTGGCKVACMQPSGALFCNGQYVDTSKTSLDDCLQALLAQYNIKATGYAYSTCTNGTCSGNAGGNVSCSAALPGSGDFALGGFAGLGMLGFGLALARRRRARA